MYPLLHPFVVSQFQRPRANPSLPFFFLPQDLPTEPGAAGSQPGQSLNTLDESENLAGVQRSGGSEGSAETQRKASLKEKISGGMKVVSGKLGNDKSKVEEGKKLMHGQSA